MSDLDGMIQLKDWNETVPSIGQLRTWLRKGLPGISDCFSRVGSLTFVDKKRIFEWIKEQKWAPRPTPKVPSLLKGKKRAVAAKTEDENDLI